MPKLRKGSYFPTFLEPRRIAEKAIAGVVQEAYIQGVSTRPAGELVQAMGLEGISKSQVSRPCEEIDAKVKPFLGRPIEGGWPYLRLDATCVKARRGGRIVAAAVVIAIGGNSDGRREVLGLDICPSEAETFWTDLPRASWRGAAWLRWTMLRSERAKWVPFWKGNENSHKTDAQKNLAALPEHISNQSRRVRANTKL